MNTMPLRANGWRRARGLISVAMLLIGGCTSVTHLHQQQEHDYANTSAAVENAGELAPAVVGQRTARREVSAYPYVNTTAVSRPNKLPTLLDNPITLNTPSEDVWTLLADLSKLIGVQVVADDDITDTALQRGAASTGRIPPPPTGTVDATLMQSTSSAGGSAGMLTRASIAPVSFHGTGWEVIEHIAGMLDAAAKYDPASNTVRIYRYETRTFHIDQVAGDTTAKVAMSSDQGTEIQGATGQSTHASTDSGDSVSWSESTKFWDKLTASLALMRSAAGSAVVNEAMSEVVVRDRYDRMPQIESYVEALNASLQTEVAVKITIYRITDTDSDDRGVSWSTLYNTAGQMADKVGASISTAESSLEGLSQFVISAPTTKSDGAASLFSGSQFFLQMLNTIGHASVDNTATLSALNNVPTSTKSVVMNTYLAQTTSLYTAGTTTTSSAVGAGATLTAGSVETGFSATIVPSIDPDGHRVLIKGKVSLSTLDQMETYTSGGNSIQEPKVSLRSFLPNKWMRSGETLVVAGFAARTGSNNTTSPTSQSLWMLAGNRDLAHGRDLIVVAISPVVSAPSVTM